MTPDDFFILGVATLAVLVLNFIPTFVALARQHPERGLLAKLNILSLLSFLLWFALLVWAIGGKRDESVIGRFVGGAGNRGRLIALVAVLVSLGVATTAYAVSQA